MAIYFSADLFSEKMKRSPDIEIKKPLMDSVVTDTVFIKIMCDSIDCDTLFPKQKLGKKKYKYYRKPKRRKRLVMGKMPQLFHILIKKELY